MKKATISTIIIICMLLLTGLVLADNETNTTDNETAQPDINVTINVTTNDTINDTNDIPDLNVTINDTNTTTNTTTNSTNNDTNTTNPSENNNTIKITSTTPPNGKIYGKDDNLPTTVTITYEGNVDWEESNNELLHNGESRNWIIKRPPTNNAFSYQLDQSLDGIYTGNWSLISTDNQTTNYNYSFSILTTQPPKATNIQPSKGQYTNEERTLEARINGTQYAIQWLINDGYPSATDSQWKGLTPSGDRYIANIDFENTNIGALYLKVIDDAGNYRIQPTGIISAPKINIDIEDNKITSNPGEETTYKLTINKKNPEQETLRCKLSDLYENQGTAAEKTININDITYITYEDEEIKIQTAYDRSMNIGRNTQTNIDLTIKTPLDTTPGEYEGTITCLVN